VSLEAVQTIIANYVYPALLVVFFFGLTIFIHELGHFWVARKRGMKIERFSIGFGPKIFGWQKDGIEYRVCWLLFGGYVALPQMSPMETIEGKTESQAEELPPATPASKILVALAGPAMNIVLAFLIGCILWQVGMPAPSNSTVIGWVEPGSLEEQKGVLPGDRIVSIDGKDVKKWSDVMAAVATSLDSAVRVVIDRHVETMEFLIETTVQRDFGIKMTNLYPRGRPIALKIKPNSPAARAGIRRGDEFLAVEGVPVHGSQQLVELVSKRADKPTELKVMREGQVVTLTVVPEYDERANGGRMQVTLGEQVVKPGPTPVEQFRDVVGMLQHSLYAVVHSKQTGVGVRSFSGPVGIGFGWWAEFASGGMRRGLWLAVVLNINLAILNLLPLPVLDGGHIVFAVIEAIFRRPLNAKLVQAASTAFAILLIGFMLYITVFDIQKLLPSQRPAATEPATNAPAAQPAAEP
jgi:regulator of sigma E protease